MTVRIKWNKAGFEQVRRLPGVEAKILAIGQDIAKTAGDGYEANLAAGKTRSRVSVRAETFRASRDNAKNNTLVKALGGYSK